LAATRRSDIAGERIARHGLVARPATSIAGAAALTCGLQAQEASAARLGVRARMRGVADADVRRAVDVDHVVVRTWLMRATIHLVPASDVRWMTDLFAAMIIRKFAARWRQLGLTTELLERCATAMPDILAGRTLTRAQIVSELASVGLEFDLKSQAPVHVLLHTSALGLTCRAADRNGEATFALIADWVPKSPPGPSADDALAELARRYFRAYSRDRRRLHHLVRTARQPRHPPDPRRARTRRHRRSLGVSPRHRRARTRAQTAARVRQLPARLPRPRPDNRPAERRRSLRRRHHQADRPAQRASDRDVAPDPQA
jgi:hypothetical protein